MLEKQRGITSRHALDGQSQQSMIQRLRQERAEA
jgi:hypothetical protein